MNSKPVLLTLTLSVILLALAASIRVIPNGSACCQEEENREGKIRKTEKDIVPEKVKARKLNSEVLKRKKEGWFPGFVPIVSFNSDDGFGGGLVAILFNNGKKGDRYFEYAPYYFRLFAEAYATTYGRQTYILMLDMPYFLDTPFRIRATGKYYKQINANYYGIGNRMNRKLTTRFGNRYSAYALYKKRYLDAYDPFNPYFIYYPKPVNYKFNKYIIERPEAYLNLYLEGIKYLRILAGVYFQKIDVNSWATKKFNTPDSKNVLSAPTLIDIDPAAARDNRHTWINMFRAGIGFDNRDYGPDPRDGFLIDFTVEYSTKYLGSGYNYLRYTFGARSYYSPVTHLTFALRLAFTATAGNVPFYKLGSFSFMYDEQQALGNNRTLRGYPQTRFIGDTMTLGNLELRWEFYEFTLLKQHLSLRLLGFVDAGSVFNNAHEAFTVWSNYHIGYGGGMLVVWNQAAVIHFYAGFSREDKSFSVDVEHAI